MDVAGTSTEMDFNTGMCGSDAMCDSTKSSAEASGALSDWKCGTCSGDKCNTE